MISQIIVVYRLGTVYAVFGGFKPDLSFKKNSF